MAWWAGSQVSAARRQDLVADLESRPTGTRVATVRAVLAAPDGALGAARYAWQKAAPRWPDLCVEREPRKGRVMAKKKGSGQDLEAKAEKALKAPTLAYQPARTRRYHPPIGLIGCGGISKAHLTAYRDAGYNVVALCDLIPERAAARREEFFPDADTYTDYRELLSREDIEVVDIATHPQDREYLIPAALSARKHVLSQKPFVLDLDKGRAFAELADRQGVKLAVNQNGRWAPYFSYMRQAVNKGLIGEVMSVHLACHWNHEWIKDSHFNRVHHVVLYDFANAYSLSS
jgi:hypothetical protein